MFKILKKSKSSQVRLGLLNTSHGKLETPFFMPDATRGFVKSIDAEDLAVTGIESLVVNTFHLYLNPGLDLIKKAGGIHGFMGWERPLLSDSGGFQVFSLIHKNPKMGKITDEKVIFKSPLDGSVHDLTPEKSIQIQFDLGTDMIVCLDDCPPNDLDRPSMEASIERTVDWARRCKTEYERQVAERRLNRSEKPLFFGVVQGGVEKELRKMCADALVEIGFDGFGYGARPVDEDGKFLGEIIEFTAQSVPEDSVRFALGIGTPEDIVRCASYGWDMFDCVIPTREGRHGRMFVWKSGFEPESMPLTEMLHGEGFYSILNINNARFAEDFAPIDHSSNIPALRTVSMAFLHHLFKSKDPLGMRLASLYNLGFYMELLRIIRMQIKKGIF